jgi:hypothetical protein
MMPRQSTVHSIVHLQSAVLYKAIDRSRGENYCPMLHLFDKICEKRTIDPHALCARVHCFICISAGASLWITVYRM